MNQSLTLTKEELACLSGLRQAKRIAAWLTAHGWYYEQPHGRGAFPAVDRTYYLARMSGRTDEPDRARPRLDRM